MIYNYSTKLQRLMYTILWHLIGGPPEGFLFITTTTSICISYKKKTIKWSFIFNAQRGSFFIANIDGDGLGVGKEMVQT